jgi:hypothetical protein
MSCEVEKGYPDPHAASYNLQLPASRDIGHLSQQHHVWLPDFKVPKHVVEFDVLLTEWNIEYQYIEWLVHLLVFTHNNNNNNNNTFTAV